MIIKYLLFSFLLSILSLMIVASAPIEISIRDTGKVYSPYHDELNQLEEKGKTGITPSESEYLSSLIEKNNQWFEEHHKEYLRNSAGNVREFWKKKSDYVSPVIMVLWGIAFYLFCKSKTKVNPVYILIFPVVLLIAHLMSILEVVLIALVVLAIWFWKIFEISKGEDNESTTAS